MRTVDILSVSTNHITVGTDVNIHADEAITFDNEHFLQVRLFQPGVYVVRGEVPQDATSATVGRIATTDRGTRFLTDTEEQQRVVDEQQEQTRRQVRTVTAEQFLFTVLLTAELDLLAASTDTAVRKGLLRLTVAGKTRSNEVWFTAFIDRLVARSIITATRATVIRRFDPIP